jgi:TolB-like protein
MVAWSLRGAGGSALSAPERTRVTVMPFEAVASDVESERIARIATDWVAREVAASGIANVVAPRAATVRSASPGADFDGDSAGASLYLAEPATGLLVTGHVRSEGAQLAIDVSIRDVPSMRIVRVLPGVRGATAEAMDVVEALGNRVAAALATILDERIGAWAEVSSQPPSVEAYRAFFDGLDWFARGEADSADLYFFEAARQDSQFTAPLIWAVRSRVWMHRIVEADSLARALLPERDRLAPWDRAMLDYYVAYLHGTWERAYLAAVQVERLAPDPEWSQLVASAAQAANRPRAALEALTRIDRDVGWARDWQYRWRTWTIVHHMLGEYEEERAAAEPERGEHPISVGLTEIGAFAGLGRLGAVDSTLIRLRELVRSPEGRIRILQRAVDELRAHRHGDAALPLAAEAVAIADSLVATGDSTPDRLQLLGDMLYLAGRWHESHAVLSSIETEDGSRRLLTSRGRAAGRLGWEMEARQAASKLLTDNQLDQGHSTFGAATILAALGERAEATNLLRRAIAEGFGFYPWVHTVWEFENLADYEPFQELVRPRD